MGINRRNMGGYNAITLNQYKPATNVKIVNNESGTSWNNQLFEYSGEELINETNISFEGGTLELVTVSWTNCNPASIVSDGSEITIDCYRDISGQEG